MWTVDGYGVMLHLLRGGLPPDVKVYTRLPDQIVPNLPMVVLQRTGGDGSRSPHFRASFFTHIQCWSDATTEHADPQAAAEALADKVTEILFMAWRNQTVTPAGWIIDYRDSSGFQQEPDPDLPYLGRTDQVVDLLIRRPQAA